MVAAGAAAAVAVTGGGGSGSGSDDGTVEPANIIVNVGSQAIPASPQIPRAGFTATFQGQTLSSPAGELVSFPPTRLPAGTYEVTGQANALTAITVGAFAGSSQLGVVRGSISSSTGQGTLESNGCVILLERVTTFSVRFTVAAGAGCP